LRELLKKKSEWSWGYLQESAFRDIKKEPGSTPCLGHYDPNKEKFGLGAVLKQKMSDGKWIQITYASRSLSPTEGPYAQIEKESLAST
jgi:hypothetical protein